MSSDDPSASSEPLNRGEIDELADIIMTMQRCFTLSLSEELSRGQVSFPQFFLLGHIAQGDPLTMTEIAEKMDHTTAAATGLVDRLENLGYVQRSSAGSDRRKVFVTITPKGAQLVSRIRQDMVDSLIKVRDLLTPHEQRMWLQIYKKLQNYCQQKTGTCTK